MKAIQDDGQAESLKTAYQNYCERIDQVDARTGNGMANQGAIHHRTPQGHLSASTSWVTDDNAAPLGKRRKFA
jgi:hypothetical protein